MEQESKGMNDLISRQDAINAIENTDCELTSENWDELTDAIKNVPSAEQEEFEWCYDCKEYDQEAHCCHRWTKCIRQTIDEIKSSQWIPCSERLPEKDGYYLVTLNFEWGKEIEMGWLFNGEWLNPNSHVTVAWCELPEPWEGSRE